MRMWNVPIAMLCKKHLLQEHASMHAFAYTIVKGKPMDAYIERGHCDCSVILHRHNVLARELLDRGSKHHTPMSSTINFPSEGHVDVNESIRRLKEICPDCAARYENLNTPEGNTKFDE